MCQTVKHVVRIEFARHHDGQTAPRELVDHGQHAKPPAVLGAVVHEVVGPHVVGPLGPETDARPVVEPQAATFRLFLRHFEPFPAPDAIDALDADPPAFVDEQLTDTAVAVAAILLGEPNNRLGERGLVLANLGLAALRRTRLPNDRARTTLRNRKLQAHVLNARALPRRAQYFPDSASFKICLSSVSSDTAFFNRSFSRSRSFNRFAWSIFSPPYSRRHL